MTISIVSSFQIPHPIPYQGSKRKLCPTIAVFIKNDVETLYEPFAGSAAFTLYAARHNLAERFVIGDALAPLIELWKLIVSNPNYVSGEYQQIWAGQKEGDKDYFNRVRERYNNTKDPVLLLYLIARCVKNAVRFNKNGHFTQSADRRRLGMHPLKMREAIQGASTLLSGRVDFFSGDFEECLAGAGKRDLAYMDPPYQGTTYGRDKRYYQQLKIERLCHVLSDLNERSVPFLLSYDGKHGDKEYGITLPERLEMHRILINTGRSSQATLNGKNTVTLEGLYVSKTFIEDSEISQALTTPLEQLRLFA